MVENDTLLRIKKIMEQKSWTIYQLAKECNIAYSSLSNLFQRNTEPTLPTLRKICAGLGISLSDFFSDEPAPIMLEYSADERLLVSLYQSLKLPDKKLLTTYAHALNRKLPE
ncbi:MAG: helix-turn-helix transcriptional regulator [Lachnospiraceae bacterium]|nr:helix-turn-helix transcriptional regulator [Lachnospiraceae bacterium]